MRRNTLAAFFRSVVIAALPLAGACNDYRTCGSSWTVDGGVEDGGCFARCLKPGGGTTGFCTEKTNSSGGAVTECSPDCTGRRPEGLAPAEISGPALGKHFARMAHLEAASVPAFRRLRAELRAHGAPQRLVDACTRAARDELRHARVTARLARRFGAATPQVAVRSTPPRTLLAIAVENAREGCVRESFGALVATWQAQAAADHEVRTVMERIALDETRHAELAWEIDAWLSTRLGAAERQQMKAARADELARIAAGLSAMGQTDVARSVGLPSPSVALALHRAFAGEVARRSRAAAAQA